MNYRSVSSLADTVRHNLHKIPDDVDLIVGVPRSGMLVANMLALHLNLKVTDVEGYLANRKLIHGQTRKTRAHQIQTPSEASCVLFVDDSVNSGASIEAVRDKTELVYEHQTRLFGAAYTTSESRHRVDISFETVDWPRVFEWNAMHRHDLIDCCVDIDGVLCRDPTGEQNDDGSLYVDFLLNAEQLAFPTYPIGHLVTSRLEKYREETKSWLAKHGIEYMNLHMLDLPDAETRRRLNCHAGFKADIYRNQHRCNLFIESDPTQAATIARNSGKPVLCYFDQKVYQPHVNYAMAKRHASYVTFRGRNLMRRLINKIATKES